MKLLYALQATGNGHVARANVLVPELRKFADVDVLVSGTNAQLKANFDYKKYDGISLFYAGNGDLDYRKIALKNKFTTFLKSLNRCKINDYDVVLNDFEPITAWASKIKNVPMLSLSHQWAVKHQNSPKPAVSNKLAKLILEQYAPANQGFGFHFKSYHSSIFLPLLRKEILGQNNRSEPFILVYLPSFHHEFLIEFFNVFKAFRFVIFSPSVTTNFKLQSINLHPIDGEIFMQHLLRCEGVICNAGFELPSEVLYLKKKLFVIPIARQYEQLCNYTALKKMGVDGNLELSYTSIQNWLHKNAVTQYVWEDQTQEVVEKVLQTASNLKADR